MMVMFKLAILDPPRERLFISLVRTPQEATEKALGCGFCWAWEPAQNAILLFLGPWNAMIPNFFTQ